MFSPSNTSTNSDPFYKLFLKKKKKKKKKKKRKKPFDYKTILYK